ncbi:hypothetical protein BU14_0183s0024 [Porphyra umbilicalis]|uniref:Uncharacterized protein n=1 Tax=Porphyra umbilicalis TaxID=2786 RepID=A0A1X6P6W9_PORUM|nr:hypothetical protein BU14_0183s0024 [Porphyra umbilicalis]|eukprot:OSX76632.1 hypothetical protein BU14_0183s0024 [Porphyra umbilicalis]
MGGAGAPVAAGALAAAGGVVASVSVAMVLDLLRSYHGQVGNSGQCCEQAGGWERAKNGRALAFSSTRPSGRGRPTHLAAITDAEEHGAEAGHGRPSSWHPGNSELRRAPFGWLRSVQTALGRRRDGPSGRHDKALRPTPPIGSCSTAVFHPSGSSKQKRMETIVHVARRSINRYAPAPSPPSRHRRSNDQRPARQQPRQPRRLGQESPQPPPPDRVQRAQGRQRGGRHARLHCRRVGRRDNAVDEDRPVDGVRVEEPRPAPRRDARHDRRRAVGAEEHVAHGDGARRRHPPIDRQVVAGRQAQRALVRGARVGGGGADGQLDKRRRCVRVGVRKGKYVGEAAATDGDGVADGQGVHAHCLTRRERHRRVGGEAGRLVGRRRGRRRGRRGLNGNREQHTVNDVEDAVGGVDVGHRQLGVSHRGGSVHQHHPISRKRHVGARQRHEATGGDHVRGPQLARRHMGGQFGNNCFIGFRHVGALKAERLRERHKRRVGRRKYGERRSCVGYHADEVRRRQRGEEKREVGVAHDQPGDGRRLWGANADRQQHTVDEVDDAVGGVDVGLRQLGVCHRRGGVHQRHPITRKRHVGAYQRHVATGGDQVRGTHYAGGDVVLEDGGERRDRVPAVEPSEPGYDCIKRRTRVVALKAERLCERHECCVGRRKHPVSARTSSDRLGLPLAISAIVMAEVVAVAAATATAAVAAARADATPKRAIVWVTEEAPERGEAVGTTNPDRCGRSSPAARRRPATHRPCSHRTMGGCNGPHESPSRRILDGASMGLENPIEACFRWIFDGPSMTLRRRQVARRYGGGGRTAVAATPHGAPFVETRPLPARYAPREDGLRARCRRRQQKTRAGAAADEGAGAPPPPPAGPDSVWRLRCYAAARRESHLDRATAARTTRTSDGRNALRARAHANDAVVGHGVHRRGGGGAPRRRTRPAGKGKLLPPESFAATDGGGGGRSGGDGPKTRKQRLPATV